MAKIIILTWLVALDSVLIVQGNSFEQYKDVTYGSLEGCLEASKLLYAMPRPFPEGVIQAVPFCMEK
jgi:hypothetical protein